MRSLLYVGALALVALSGAWAYRVNYATLDALARVEALQSEITAEREAIAVLRAEWAWLNRPERLARLAAAFGDELGLRPMRPTDFGTVAAVAYQPPPPHGPGGRAEAVARAETSDAPGAAPAAEAGPVRPAAPAAPRMAAAEPAPKLEEMVGALHLALGVPLPERRPLRLAGLE